MMIMEHQENLEKFVVFKTNNHHVSMKVSLRSSFQFEDEVHDLLASYIVYLRLVFIARVYVHFSNLQCVYTFYVFFSISLIKLNKINKTKQKIKKNRLFEENFIFQTIFTFHSRGALRLYFYDVMIK